MADDTLHIGDVVSLYSIESNGYVFSSQSSSVHNGVAVGSGKDKIKPTLKERNMLAFEICAANRYKFNKELRHLKTDVDGDPDGRSQLDAAQLKADAETDTNEAMKKIQNGKKLRYGRIVQLKHKFTSKYIHVNALSTSTTESNNMAVELLEYNAKYSQFKVMPRDKVKAEGDVVHIGDQIVFENVKFQDRYLHVSKTLIGGPSVYQREYELNLSVQQSWFNVYRQHKHPEEESEKKVKVGDIVRLYHRNIEAYLVAEGVFEEKISEDVHLRIRTLDWTNPKTWSPSCSPIMYWRIELQEKYFDGGVLKWGHQCKLMHMCTRKYLCVAEDKKVTLTLDQNDRNTAFRLHPVIKESGDIPESSQCIFEHVLTGQWLHASTNSYRGKDDALKWSTAELREIGVIEEKQFDDAFTIQPVDESLQIIFNFVAGMVPFIQKFLLVKKAGVILNSKMADDVIAALNEISNFMMVDGRPIKKRQKLMRSLRVVDLLINLLKSSYNESEQSNMNRIFSATYDVLSTYLMGHSRKNKLYIAKHIDFFFTQFAINEGNIRSNAVHIVTEIVRDNRTLVDRISHKHIDRLVDSLRYDKNHRFLELLSVLCVCDGTSVVDNQTYITDVYLLGDNREHLYFTDLGQTIGEDYDKVYITTNQGSDWVELRTFVKRNEQNPEYLFYKHQLQLFKNLCHGQNTHSIAAITQELNYLTWEEAFTCLSDDKVPDQLRAIYCDLIITLFVDVAEHHSVLDEAKRSYIYTDIDNDEPIDNSHTLIYKHFPSLSQWITECLHARRNMIDSLIPTNMLIKQVFRLVYYLFLFGFYDKSGDIKKMLEPLMSLLDGRNDKPHTYNHAKEEMLTAFRKSERFQPSPETRAIVEAKIQGLEVLDLFVTLIGNVRLEKFMNLCKMTNNQTNNGDGSAELAPLMSDTFNLEQNTSVANGGLKELARIFHNTSVFGRYELVDILLDLSNNEYDDLKVKSMHLLSGYFSSHKNLFKQAEQAQILVTEVSIDVFKIVRNKVPVLKKLCSARLVDADVKEMSPILDDLIRFCYLEGEEEEPHAMNQSILYNNGIIEIAFAILEQDVNLLGEDSGLREVFEKTFILLKSLAHGNKVVQECLFDRLDFFLSKAGTEQELAKALIEVFTGNIKTCMKIAQHQVQKIMALVAQHKTSVPQFLDLLNAVVKVEDLDLPLKRNQGFIMTSFIQFRSDFAMLVDIEEDVRAALLTSPNSPDLTFYVSMVDLLALCAEGKNTLNRSICQSILKVPEILRVLINPDISDDRKRPFLHFFLSVYMDTDGPMLEGKTLDIPHDPAIWEYIDILSKTFASVAEYNRNNKETVEQSLRKYPGKREQVDDTVEDIRGSLRYLFDAVMPFLQIFCCCYYQVDKVRHPNEQEVLSALANNCMSFFKSVEPLVSSEQQRKKLVVCMSVLFSCTTPTLLDMNEFKRLCRKGISSEHEKSEARMVYEKYYQEEENINTQLHAFTVNMKSAYEGMSSVKFKPGDPAENDNCFVAELEAHLSCFVDLDGKTVKEKYQKSEKLVKQLTISTDIIQQEKIDKLDLDIRCIKLLRDLLHNEIIKVPQNYTNESAKQLKMITDVQDALTHYKSADILKCLKHATDNDDVVCELMAFLCALLFNGNEGAQDAVYKCFTETRHILLLRTMNDIIRSLTNSMKHRLNLQSIYKDKIQEVEWFEKTLKVREIDHKMLKMIIIPIRESLLGSISSTCKSLLSRQKRKTEEKIRRNDVTPKVDPNEQVARLSGASLGISSWDRNRVAPSSDDDLHSEGEAECYYSIKELFNATEDLMCVNNEDHIVLVLRTLGALCENQHSKFQDYLRDQPLNKVSVNLVVQVTDLLNSLSVNIQAGTIHLVTLVFETLTRLASGNTTNQRIIFDNQICNRVNKILRAEVSMDCDENQVFTLEKAIGFTLSALTEENHVDEVESDFSKVVMGFIDTDLLVSTMVDAYTEKKITDVNVRTLRYEVMLLFYRLLARKLDLFPNLTTEDVLKTTEQHHVFHYCADRTFSVEIVKSSTLQKLYFPVKDKSILSSYVKDEFKQAVDRSSPINKIHDFMEWTSDIIYDIEHQTKVRRNPLGRLLLTYWVLLNYAVYLLSVTIAITVMVTWVERDDDAHSQRPAFKFRDSRIVLFVFGGVHNFLSLLIFFGYVIKHRLYIPTVLKFADLNVVTPFVKNLYMNRKKSADDTPEEVSTVNDKERRPKLAVKFYDFNTIYYFIFLCCSIAGTGTDGYFFAFHLLHIIQLNRTLRRVLQAITKNGCKLMLVAILGIVVFYIYSLILFAFYRGRMWSADNGRHCRNIYECFVSVLNHGFVGGPYTQFEGIMGDDFQQAIGIMFFDVSFYVLVTILGLNIVLGIILENFWQIKDAKLDVDRDIQTTCFICSRQRFEFEKKLGVEGYQRHITVEHNLWSYMYFLLHLHDTRPRDHSALENYVHKMVISRNYSFFPFGRALCLETEESNAACDFSFTKPETRHDAKDGNKEP